MKKIIILLFVASVAQAQVQVLTLPQKFRDSTTASYDPIRFLTRMDSILANIHRTVTGNEIGLLLRVRSLGRSEATIYSGIEARSKGLDSVLSGVYAVADGLVKINALHGVIIGTGTGLTLGTHGTNAVTSVFGRTGGIAAMVGDYSAFYITKTYTTVDSLRFRKLLFTGAPLTTGTPGEVYWDSTQRAFMGRGYAQLRSFDMSNGVVTASVIDTNSTTETTLYTVTREAFGSSVGKVIIVKLYGIYTTTAGVAKTVKYRMKRNGVTIDSVTTSDKSITDQPWALEWITTYRSLGATGNLARQTHMYTEAGDYWSSGLGTFDSTVPNTLTVTCQISAAGANYVKLRQGWTETIN